MAQYPLTPQQQEDNHEQILRVRRAVNARENEALGNIGRINGEIQYAMYQAINPPSAARVFAGGLSLPQKYAAESNRYAEEALTEEERVLRRQERAGRTIRASVDEAHFAQASETLHNNHAEGHYIDGTGVLRNVDVEIDFTNAYWNRRERTVNEIQTAVQNSTVADLTARGVTLGALPAPFTVFTANQAREIAEHLFVNENLRNALRDVSPVNRAIVMDLAQTMTPAELYRIVTGGQPSNPEAIRDLEVQREIFPHLEKLAAMDVQAANEQDVNDRITELQGIQTGLNGFVDGTGRFPIPANDGGNLVMEELGNPVHRDFEIVRNNNNRSAISSAIQKLIKERQQSRDAYRQMRSEAAAIINAYTSRGLAVPNAIVTGTMTATGLPENLTTATDPKAIAAAIKRDLLLPETLEEIKTQLGNLRNQANQNTNKQLSGKDLALAIYQDRFQNHGNPRDRLSAIEARMAAQEIYSRNTMAREEIKYFNDTVSTQEVLGEPPRQGWDYFTQGVSQIAYGRPESFICNLASDINPNMVTFFGTRSPFMAFMGRKIDARPKWNSASPVDLMKAFYAIRNAVREKDLANTPYVRAQIKEIGRIMLLPRNARYLFAELDRMQTEDPDLRNRLNSMTEDQRLRFALDQLMLRTELTEPYASGVTRAIGYARANTAKKRKFVAAQTKERSKDLIGMNTTKWYNPLTWPSGIVKGGWRATKATVGGVGTAIKSGWNNTWTLGGAAGLGFLAAGPFGSLAGLAAGSAISYYRSRHKSAAAPAAA